MKKLIAMSFGLFLCFSNSLMADTTDQKWMNKVELTKTGMHCSDDANCFNRYHPDIPSRQGKVGDMLVFTLGMH